MSHCTQKQYKVFKFGSQISHNVVLCDITQRCVVLYWCIHFLGKWIHQYPTTQIKELCKCSLKTCQSANVIK